MMPRARTVGMASLGMALVLFASSRWGLLAQVHDPKVKGAPAPIGVAPAAAAEKVSVQEAMTRPFAWSLAEETKLQDVVALLKKRLGAPVVLDRAALARKKVTPESVVRLELEGVRLKTGLKLLLDQVGLTAHIVPEDNLLVLTDAEGSNDPNDRLMAEVKALHHDIHALQDEVVELRGDFAPEEEAGPALRKPTIIEDLPEGQDKDMPGDKPARRPGL